MEGNSKAAELSPGERHLSNPNGMNSLHDYLDRQQKTIISFIDTTVQGLNERVDKVVADIESLKRLVDIHNTIVNGKIEKVQDDVDDFKDQFTAQGIHQRIDKVVKDVDSLREISELQVNVYNSKIVDVQGEIRQLKENFSKRVLEEVEKFQTDYKLEIEKQVQQFDEEYESSKRSSSRDDSISPREGPPMRESKLLLKDYNNNSLKVNPGVSSGTRKEFSLPNPVNYTDLYAVNDLMSDGTITPTDTKGKHVTPAVIEEEVIRDSAVNVDFAALFVPSINDESVPKKYVMDVENERIDRKTDIVSKLPSKSGVNIKKHENRELLLKEVDDGKT